ncbi:MAG: insulinase family protein, partial [Gemmatimonadetes bacterium]|nr:insulinase family protein [Gemmatimonadota bacterium]
MNVRHLRGPLGSLALGLAVAAAGPTPVAAQNVQAPRLHVLENGLRILTVEDHSSPIVTTVWSAHVGDSAEPLDFTGNSHYLEHLLLFRGTEQFPKNAIGEWVAGRGGYFNGHTWYDYTTFEITCATDDLPDALDRHEDMMFHAAFSGEDFELEKKAVFEELRAALDQPYGYLWMTSPYLMYPGETFYSRSTIGTIEAVEAATVQRVRNYYKDYYVPSNMTLAVVGDIDTERTVADLRKRFGGYPAGSVPEALYEPLPMKPGITVATEERAVGKAYLLLAVEGPPASSPDYFPYVLLTSCLADGATSLLRDELITQRELFDELSVSAMPRRFPLGWQAIDAEGAPAKVADGIAALWELLGRAAAGEFSTEDVDLARQRLVAAHAVQRDDQYQYASRLAEADAHGDYRIFAERAERLAHVTAADVRAVAAKYFTPDHFFLRVVFPPGETPADFEAQVRTGAAAGSGAGTGVTSRILDSGATLLHEARPGAAIESFTVAVNAGDRDGATPGTAGAVAEMLTRLTSERDKKELQAYLDRNGFRLASWTTGDAAFFSLQLPAGSTADAAALLTEILTRPAFPEEEWAAVQNEFLASLDAQLDQPRSVAWDALTTAAFAGTGYGRSVAE